MRHWDGYQTDAPEAGYTYREWVEAIAAQRARLSKLPARELPRGIEDWRRAGRTIRVLVFASRKVGAYRVSIGRGINHQAYFIRVRGDGIDTCGGFPRSAAKKIFRAVRTKTFWSDIKDILP